MAWDPYVQSIDAKYPNMLKAVGIFGQEGTKWASRGVEINAAEAAAVYNACGGDMSICGSGFTLGGDKMACTRVDGEDGSIIGKGKKGGANEGCAFFAMKINGAILFAIGNGPDAQGGSINMAVSSIAEYLRENGYGI